MKELDICAFNDGIYVIKENKTMVNYFIFDEFEIHLNKIPPNSKQEWHKHNIIEEIIVVIKGEILIRWISNNTIYDKVLTKGMIVRVKKSIHSIENNSEGLAEFVVFRMVPSGKTTKDIIKNDKVIMYPNL